ncbi:endonuclease domain-containing protein [Bacillus cereus]|nr:endonuclease domain-containing protein [Bacillus cereus]
MDPKHRYTMDFMVIPNNKTKIIIEIDGREHYSELKNKQYIAKPCLYAAQVKEDRELKLKGYSVFRFGGFEVMDGKEEDLTEEMKKVFNPYFDVIN